MNWQHQALKMPASRSSEGRLMNVLEIYKHVDILSESVMALLVVRLLS